MSNTNQTIKTGSILISAPSLEDPYFDKVVIYITEYNDKGALGFVMNQVFERTFSACKCCAGYKKREYRPFTSYPERHRAKQRKGDCKQ